MRAAVSSPSWTEDRGRVLTDDRLHTVYTYEVFICADATCSCAAEACPLLAGLLLLPVRVVVRSFQLHLRLCCPAAVDMPGAHGTA